jgi:hypothetical protein
VVYQPLSPAEKAKYEGLLAKYGTQFEPDDNEKMLINETKRLTQK